MRAELCEAAVTRMDGDEPCERLAVTYRHDDEGDSDYPVCRRHAGPMALGLLLARPHQPLAGFPMVGVVLTEGPVMGA